MFSERFRRVIHAPRPQGRPVRGLLTNLPQTSRLCDFTGRGRHWLVVALPLPLRPALGGPSAQGSLSAPSIPSIIAFLSHTLAFFTSPRLHSTTIFSWRTRTGVVPGH